LQVDTAPDLYVRDTLTLIKISGDRAFKSRLGLHLLLGLRATMDDGLLMSILYVS